METAPHRHYLWPSKFDTSFDDLSAKPHLLVPPRKSCVNGYLVRPHFMPEVGLVGHVNLHGMIEKVPEKHALSPSFFQQKGRNYGFEGGGLTAFDGKKSLTPEYQEEPRKSYLVKAINCCVEQLSPDVKMYLWLENCKPELLELFARNSSDALASFLKNLVQRGVLNRSQVVQMLNGNVTVEQKFSYLQQSLMTMASLKRGVAERVLASLESVTISEHLVCGAVIDSQMHRVQSLKQKLHGCVSEFGLDCSHSRTYSSTSEADNNFQWLTYASPHLEALFSEYSPVMDLFIAELFKFGLIDVSQMRKLSESNTSAQDKLLYFWQLPVVCNSGFASKFMSALLNVKQQSDRLREKEKAFVRNVVKVLNEASTSKIGIMTTYPRVTASDRQTKRMHWLLSSNRHIDACCSNPKIFSGILYQMVKVGLLTSSEYEILVSSQINSPMHLTRTLELILVGKNGRSIDTEFLRLIQRLSTSSEFSRAEKTNINCLETQLARAAVYFNIDVDTAGAECSKIESPILRMLISTDREWRSLCHCPELLDRFLSECINLKLINNQEYESIAFPYQHPTGCLQSTFNMHKLIAVFARKNEADLWKIISALEVVKRQTQLTSAHLENVDSLIHTMMKAMGLETILIYKGGQVAQEGYQWLNYSSKNIRTIFREQKLTRQFINELKKERMLTDRQVKYYLDPKIPAYRKTQKLIWEMGGYSCSQLRSIFQAIAMMFNKRSERSEELLDRFLLKLQVTANDKLLNALLPVLQADKSLPRLYRR